MSKVIYVCKTEEGFRELCNVFKFKRDFNFFTWEDICLRVVDGVALDWGLASWYTGEGRFTDYRVIRYRKGMCVYVKDDIKIPKHYELERLELEGKHVIKEILGKEGYKNWCHGTALKYLFRAGKKENELKDFKKAKEYISWIIKEMEDQMKLL